MAQITVKDAAGATQTVAKLANTGPLTGVSTARWRAGSC